MRFRILLLQLFGLLSLTLIVLGVYSQGDVTCLTNIGGHPTPARILAAISVLIPPILLWWWWVRIRHDFGLGRLPRPAPRRSGLVLAVIALPLLVAGTQDAANAFRWWQGFHAWRATDNPPRLIDLSELIRPLAPAIWCLVLGTACCLAAARLIRSRSQVPTEGNRTSKAAIGFFVLVLVSEALRLFCGAPELITRGWHSPDSVASIGGTIGDEDGNPISGVLVEIHREEQAADRKQRQGATDDWGASDDSDVTDARGAYIFKRLRPGTYVLGVNCYVAPDGRSPYPATFYPGVGTESLAARIAAVPKAPRVLAQLRLRRLRLATVNIEVRWEDGSSPEWSNLEFYNLSSHNRAVIGGECPGVKNGAGEIMVPEGFTYDAQAHVACDAGSEIETRESLPIRRIAIAPGTIPRRLVFVIPGPPCKLWRPQETAAPR